MLHIDLARWADLILVAPATAEIISKIAHGRANDLLSTTILASNSLLAVAPSMNKNMWENKITQENINVLNKNKITILGPDHGKQACGDVGYGRMLEPEQIFYAVQELLSKKEGLFKDKKVIITAAERGTIANTPHKIRLKKIDARMPITNSDAKILINDDRTIKMTRSLNTTIMPATSILDSLLKFFSMCSFSWFVYEKI